MEIIEGNFKRYHNVLLTYEKMFEMGKENQVVVQFADSKNKDIIHNVLGCNELHDIMNK